MSVYNEDLYTLQGAKKKVQHNTQWHVAGRTPVEGDTCSPRSGAVGSPCRSRLADGPSRFDTGKPKTGRPQGWPGGLPWRRPCHQSWERHSSDRRGSLPRRCQTRGPKGARDSGGQLQARRGGELHRARLRTGLLAYYVAAEWGRPRIQTRGLWLWAQAARIWWSWGGGEESDNGWTGHGSG